MATCEKRSWGWRVLFVLVAASALGGAGTIGYFLKTDPLVGLAAKLHASTASSGNQFAMATGLIDEDAEGVFVLDHDTGVLKCAVLNHRTRKFAARFEANVTRELGPAKNAKYQMVTGMVNFSHLSAAGPGMSVVYVLNSANGEMAAYGIPWQREASATGRPQVGTLKAIDGMQVRR